MRVIVSSQIKIENPTRDVKLWCEDNLVLANPEYAKKQRMNFWIGNTPKTLRLFTVNADSFVVPYGCLRQLLTMITSDDTIVLDMPKPKAVDFKADIPLYDYQEKAVLEMYNAQYGILCSPTASGKTQMGLALAIMTGTKTLWLTHTHDLLNQSKDRAEQYISRDLIGTITEGKVNIGETITFATVQTMSNLDLTLYRNEFDTIIVDECHRVCGTPTAVTQFSKVLNNLTARHKYGLSATVHRADGLIKATYALLGEVVCTVSEEEIADKLIKPSIKAVPTKIAPSLDYLDTDGTIIHNKLINWLTTNEYRNRLIVDDLIENANHYCLILSDRVSHLKELMELLPNHLQESAVRIDGKMTSKTAKQEREQALEDMRQGKKHYLFATYALAKEGLDIPRLDRLFLTTPQKDYTVITQSIGRISRVHEDKDEAIVYDYVDEKILYLRKTYKKRCTTYNKLKCKFK